MNKIKLLCAVLLGLALVTGCKTTPSKVIAASAVTVDKAMQAWAVYVVDGHATDAQRFKVRELQSKYYAAEDAMLIANAMYEKMGIAPTWQDAARELIAAENTLVEFITSVTGKAKP